MAENRRSTNTIVIHLSGGCWNGYDATDGSNLDLFVFDWDDFEDEPIGYWQDRAQAVKDLLQRNNPDAYADIQETLREAQAERDSEQAQDARQAEAVREMN